MKSSIHIGIIGDFDACKPSHPATESALRHAAIHEGLNLWTHWEGTAGLENGTETRLQDYDALLCAPGSPYESLTGALAGIRFAREGRRVFLGTCGGFQHALLEYAVNVLALADAAHEEYAPDAEIHLISRLACSLADTAGDIGIVPGSLLHEACGAERITERYQCGFGLNPGFRSLFEESGFRVTGTDSNNEVRAMELSGHPFFVGTLFQPQLSSMPEHPHPLLCAFLAKAALA